MELINSKDVLIDRAEIYNFDIVGIDDVDWLIDNGILVTNINGSNYVQVNNIRFSYIRIVDDVVIKEFKYGISKIGTECGKMILTIDDDDYHNLNCHTMVQFKEHIHRAQLRLIEAYHLQTCKAQRIHHFRVS